jgi:lipopolysaccharide transport system ATP-binding protein
MGEASRQGRTVLFVSHNLAALLALCTRGVVLEDGRLVALGPIQEAVQAYLQRLAAGRGDERAAPREHGFVRAQIVDVANPDAGPQASLDARRSYRLELRCRLPSSSDLNVGVTLFNEAEVGAISGSARDSLQGLPAGEVRLSVELPVSRLPSGRYRLEGAIWDPRRRYDQSDALLLFDVVNPGSAPEIAGLKPQGATLFDDPWTAEPAAR